MEGEGLGLFASCRISLVPSRGDSGFRISGLGLRASGLGLRVKGLGISSFRENQVKKKVEN